MTHKKKIAPTHFKEIVSGRKNFEIRLNDCNYQIGDIVELQEYFGKIKIPKCRKINSCKDFQHSEKQINNYQCINQRECCIEYLKEIYSGRKITIKILDIFDISDVIPRYIAFTFEIIFIKET